MIKNKWVRAVLGFFFAFAVVFGVGYWIVLNLVLFPRPQKIDIEKTRAYAFEKTVEKIKSSDTDFHRTVLNFNKNNEVNKRAINKITESLGFELSEVDLLNRYGEVYWGRDGQGAKRPSVLSEGESLELIVPDFSKLKPSKAEIDKIEGKDFTALDENYGEKIQKVISQYLAGLKEIPTKKVEFVPEFKEVRDDKGRLTGYSTSAETKQAVINQLFNKEEFAEFVERFVEESVQGDENLDWVYWSKLDDSSKGKEPDKTLGKETVSSKWLSWDALSDEEKAKAEEPIKHLTYYKTNPNYLFNESVTGGDGSLDFKAGFNVPVRTYFEKGDKKIPVDITLEQAWVGNDAINYLEKQDTRNRGIYRDSVLTFYVVKYKIRNVSPVSEIKPDLKEMFALSDEQGNLSARTGRMFGIKEFSGKDFILNPGEEAELIWWGASTEFKDKFLTWGSSFENKEDIVWFEKGVKDPANEGTETSGETIPTGTSQETANETVKETSEE